MKNFVPSEARALIRSGGWTGPTAGIALGYAQANLIVLPVEFREEFLAFCNLNQAACPVLEVLEPGSATPTWSARGADLRKDLPAYRIYRSGVFEGEVDDISNWWDGGMLGVLLGCGLTADRALVEAGVPVRHVEDGVADPTYRTNLECTPTPRLSSSLFVSMRPIPLHQTELAASVTAKYTLAHGAPIESGNPIAIGVYNLLTPDFGSVVEVRQDEVPLFWACGLTAVVALLSAKPSLVLSHKPGHMFITDLEDKCLVDRG